MPRALEDVLQSAISKYGTSPEISQNNEPKMENIPQPQQQVGKTIFEDNPNVFRANVAGMANSSKDTKEYIERGFFGNLGESFNRGIEAADIATDWYSASINLKDLNKVKERDKAYREKLLNDPIITSNKVSETLNTVSGMTPAMAIGHAQGVAAGALVVNFPDPTDLLTAPVAKHIGSMQYWYRYGAGDIFGGLIREGINPNVASAISQGAGIPYAWVERMQLNKIIPGFAKVEGEILKETTRRIALRMATEYGVDIATETLEEVGQEMISVAAEEMAKSVSNWIDGTEYANTTAGAIAKRAIDTAGSSAGALATLLLPGKAVKGKQIASARKEYKKAEAQKTESENQKKIDFEDKLSKVETQEDLEEIEAEFGYKFPEDFKKSLPSKISMGKQDEAPTENETINKPRETRSSNTIEDIIDNAIENADKDPDKARSIILKMVENKEPNSEEALKEFDLYAEQLRKQSGKLPSGKYFDNKNAIDDVKARIQKSNVKVPVDDGVPEPAEIKGLEPVNTPTFDVDNNTINYAGKNYKYVDTNVDDNGNIVSINVETEDGKTRTIRNSDAVFRLSIDKILWEMDQNNEYESLTDEELNKITLEVENEQESGIEKTGEISAENEAGNINAAEEFEAYLRDVETLRETTYNPELKDELDNIEDEIWDEIDKLDKGEDPNFAITRIANRILSVDEKMEETKKQQEAQAEEDFFEPTKLKNTPKGYFPALDFVIENGGIQAIYRDPKNPHKQSTKRKPGWKLLEEYTRIPKELRWGTKIGKDILREGVATLDIIADDFNEEYGSNYTSDEFLYILEEEADRALSDDFQRTFYRDRVNLENRGKGLTIEEDATDPTIDLDLNGDPLPFQKGDIALKGGATSAQVQHVSNLISKAVSGVKVVMNKKLYDKRLGNRKDKSDYDSLGFYDKKTNTIYINPETATENTIFHEMTHAVMSHIKQTDPKLYNLGIELIKGTKYEENARKAYKDLTEEQILEEALVSAIGDKGQSIFDGKAKSKFRTWLKRMALKFKATLKKMFPKSEWVKNLTLNQYVDYIANRMQTGKEIVPDGVKGGAKSEQRVESKGQKQTKTAAFKRWFRGSKVVDENGEPLVVYHGTASDIKEFNKLYPGIGTGTDDASMGFWFTDNIEIAREYANGRPTIPQLKFKNEGKNTYIADIFEGYNGENAVVSKVEGKIQPDGTVIVKEADGYETSYESLQDWKESVESENYYGIFESIPEYGFKGDIKANKNAKVMHVYLSIRKPMIIDKKGESWDYEQHTKDIQDAIDKGYDGVIFKNSLEGQSGESTVYLAFSPTQIKSATGNTGEFDPNNPDIRFQKMTTEAYENMSFEEFAKMQTDRKFKRESANNLETEKDFKKAETEKKVFTGEPLSVDESYEAINRQNIETKLNKKVMESVREMFNDVAQPIFSGMGDISKKIQYMMQEYDKIHNQDIQNQLLRVEGFVKNRKKLSRTNKDDVIRFDMALDNGRYDIAEKILERNGIDSKSLDEVRTLLEEIYKRGEAVGFEFGHLENYFPRRVIDIVRMIDDLGLKTFSERAIRDAEKTKKRQLEKLAQKRINAKAKKLKRALTEQEESDIYYKTMAKGWALTEEEKTNILNNILSGRSPMKVSGGKVSNMKERQFKEVTAETYKYYEPSGNALVHYIEEMLGAIHKAEIFGKGKDLEFSDYSGQMSADSIGELFGDVIEKEKLTAKQELKAKDLIQAYFNFQNMSGKISILKNLSQLMFLGQFKTAIRQFSDLVFSLQNAGIINTSGSLFSKKDMTIKNLGIDNISFEMKDGSRLNDFTNMVFKATGLKSLDGFGANTLIHASMKYYRKLALKGKIDKLKVELSEYLPKEQITEQLIKDIKADKVTPQTEQLGYNIIMKFQPRSIGKFPLGYVKGRKRRLMYSMRSFTIARFDYIRNDIFRKLASGNKDEMLRGMKNLFTFTIFTLLLESGTDLLIDFLLNKEIDLSDTAINTLLGLVGLNKYQKVMYDREGLGNTLSNTIVPQLRIATDFGRDLSDVLKGKERDFVDLKTSKYVPLFGDITRNYVSDTAMKYGRNREITKSIRRIIPLLDGKSKKNNDAQYSY